MSGVARAARRAPGRPLALLASLVVLGGCSGQPLRVPDGRVSLTTGGSHPPVGRGGPRVDALFAPGAQGAWAWLPDGTFWNGDVEFALVDAAGVPLVLEAVDVMAGLHASAPAAWRSTDRPPNGGGTGVMAFLPWSGSDADTAAWARLRVVVGSPRGGGVGMGVPRVRFAVRSAGGPGHPLHPHAPAGERFRYAVRDGRVLRDGRTIALVRPVGGEDHAAGLLVPASEGPAASAGIAAEERTVVLEGAPRREDGVREFDVWDVWLAPVGGATARAMPPDARLGFDASFDRTAKAWRTEMARGSAVLLPDSTLQAAWVAAHRLLVGNRERRLGALHFLGSPFQYRDLYLRDGARIVHALGLLGRPDLAGAALESLFEFQWPGGALLSQRGQLDGTGQALWALGSYAAHGGDRARVARLIEPAVRAARWIAVQRATSAHRGGPAAGLLPYGDPRDNELVRGHLTGNDAWAIAGLEALAPVLRAHGRGATADTVEAEARAHRARLIEVWDREARRQGRPLPPVVEGPGRDWGNVSAAYPCGVFPPDDARVLALDRHLRTRGSTDGLLTYGGPDSLHHYLGFDRTQAALRRGDRATFLADLRAILDHCQPDGSGFEIAARDGGFGDNLPPHGTFAAMLVDLVRSAVVHERGDSLVLLAGLPPLDEGIRPPRSLRRAAGLGPRLRVASAATRLGRVDLEIGVGRGVDTLRADLPAPAVVEWPSSGRVGAVSGPGGAVPVLDGRRFVLPAGSGTWLVTGASSSGTRP